MTLAYFAGRLITGTASDRTGGTWTNLAAGWRFLETDTGISYYWTGSAWNLTPNDLDIAKSRIAFVEDFIAVPTSATGVGPYYVNSVSGTVAAVSNTTTPNANQCGVARYTTGTDTTGRAGANSGSFTSLLLGNGVVRYEAYVKFATLSDGTDTYISRIGLIDSVSADAVDGVYFEYDQTTSPNWRTNTASSSTRTKTSSEVAVDTNFNRLTIVVNAAATSVSFYVNGTELTGSSASPITTNIPTATGRETALAHTIIKSAGGTARTLDIDYIAFQWDLTTRRG
jgi:SO2946-like, C-terminal domain